MKKKIGFICFICVLIGLTNYGCRNQNIEDNTGNNSQTIEDNMENNDTSEQEEAELIDEEYLLEHCGVTKEELEGIDVEEFINHYQLTAEYLEERDIHGLITWYRKMLEQEAEPAYDDYDIFRDAERGGYQDAYEEGISILTLSIDLNVEETMIFDLEQGVYYYGGDGLSVIYDYSLATKSGELSEEDIVAVRRYIREAGISKWQAVTGEEEPDVLDGGKSWALGIVCSDNQKYYYDGYVGPDGLYDMYLKLMKLIDVEVDEY